MLVFVLLGLMSIRGYGNIQKSFSRFGTLFCAFAKRLMLLLLNKWSLGEYSDPPLEDLLDWVQDNTPDKASFAGSKLTLSPNELRFIKVF